MIREENLTIAGVPALVATGDAAPRATVLLLHGFTASKEAQRKEAHSLAAHGHRAVTLDAVGHGARRYPDFDTRFAGDDFRVPFFAMIAEGAAEIPSVIAACVERGWGPVAACGISMGGFTLFGALTARAPLVAVATLVASPRWKTRDRSPHEELDRYFPTPLLMQNGGADTDVPPDDARALYQALVPRYAAAPDDLRYIEHAGEEHMFSPAAWDRAWDEVLSFFAKGSRGNERTPSRAIHPG